MQALSTRPQWALAPLRRPVGCHQKARVPGRLNAGPVCRAEFKPAAQLGRTVNVMLKKYDFLSTGIGALCVTGYFWAHGQPPLEALSITAGATIAGLVLNELLFSSDAHSQQ